MACISSITRRGSKVRTARHLRHLRPLALGVALALCGSVPTLATAAQPTACKGQLYLTFDTGNMSQAHFIADTLRQRHLKASFFLANEKTTSDNFALDPAWASFWRTLAQEGHAFGSHTMQHTRWLADVKGGNFQVKPQFGPQAGQSLTWTAAQLCSDVQAVNQRFLEMTGQRLDALWRAPSGKTSAAAIAAIQQCGYRHVGWAPAGFSGDELPSESHPNRVLLAKVLAGVKDGDIIMAHMGIWSRRDPWAPTVLPALIDGLQAKGFCFATLREHPEFAVARH